MFLGADYENIAPSILILISHITNELTNESNINLSSFNIYTDANLEQACQAEIVLNDALLDIRRSLSVYEEHPALLEVRILKKTVRWC